MAIVRQCVAVFQQILVYLWKVEDVSSDDDDAGCEEAPAPMSWRAEARAHIAEYQSPLADTIFMWHDKMSSFSQSLHLEWVMGMRQFVQSLDDGVLSVGALYAGSDIVNLLLRALADHWRAIYGIDLHLDSRCSQEHRSLLVVLAHGFQV